MRWAKNLLFSARRKKRKRTYSKNVCRFASAARYITCWVFLRSFTNIQKIQNHYITKYNPRALITPYYPFTFKLVCTESFGFFFFCCACVKTINLLLVVFMYSSMYLYPLTPLLTQYFNRVYHQVNRAQRNSSLWHFASNKTEHRQGKCLPLFPYIYMYIKTDATMYIYRCSIQQPNRRNYTDTQDEENKRSVSTLRPNWLLSFAEHTDSLDARFAVWVHMRRSNMLPAVLAQREYSSPRRSTMTAQCKER